MCSRNELEIILKQMVEVYRLCNGSENRQSCPLWLICQRR